MEQTPHDPERPNLPLTQTELELLFLAISNTLIRKGNYEAAPGVFTPNDQPEALYFRIDLDPEIVKDIFYSGNDIYEVITSPTETYISYMTPHTLDREDVEESMSNVYLIIGGVVRGTDLEFRAGYFIAEGKAGPGMFKGEVEYEYVRDEIVIDNEVVEIEGEPTVLSSVRRDIRADDAQKIRRLLDNL